MLWDHVLVGIRLCVDYFNVLFISSSMCMNILEMSEVCWML